MVAHGRVELLAHPLSQKYLQMKWHSYGKYFHLTNLLFYCIFLIFVTVYTYLLMTTANSPMLIKKECRNLTDPLEDNDNKTGRREIVSHPGELIILICFGMILLSLFSKNYLPFLS